MNLVDDIREHLGAINLVSFSGGKDSTVVLQHVFEAVKDTGTRLVIVTADTLMEIPYFQEYVAGVKNKIQQYINASQINAEIVTVTPDLRDSFWVSVLGKGYPAAHMGFRWCTGKLKVDPIVKFTRIATKGMEYTVFIGVRSAESPLRERIYQSKNYKPHHYAPILDWSSHDVWEYLLTEPCPWGDHADLVKVYKYSSDECVYGEKHGACVGNARYGCWACPLQKVTQLEMIGYHTGEQRRYNLMKRYKIMLTSMANKSATRSRIRRNGEIGVGPFLVSIRKMLFEKLKQLEIETGWTLITTDEEFHIRRHWELDKDVHNVADQHQPLLWPITEVSK
jgi:DNA sulfur modification protein DndC